MTQNGNGRRRVVITGMGAITPLGLNVEDYWQILERGSRASAWSRRSMRRTIP